VGVARRHETDRPCGRDRLWGLGVVALGLIVAGVGVSLSAWLPAAEGGAVPAAEAGAWNTLAAPSRERGTTRRQMPIPVRISIPAIGVDARVIPLGLNRDRTIQVPKDFADTGWFKPGPEPGEQGAAVVVGHLASRSAPGVFQRVRELRPGAVITIHLQDRSTVRFVADSMIRVPKNRFPTKRVYARTSQPTLRLITCAGKLNPTTGRHPDNYIVFASIVPRRR
jgi:sortase (surface protein transpeptidase)